MPKHTAEAGIVAGLLVIFADIMWPTMTPSIFAFGLFLIGALFIGGLLDVWLRPPPARVGTDAMSKREALASALDDLARAIAASPRVVIGSQVGVRIEPGSSGNVIGKQVTVTTTPGSSGNVIGEQITVNSGSTPVNDQRAQEISDGAQLVRQGAGSKSSIGTLINQAFLPGSNPNLNAAIDRASQALQNSDLP